MTQIDINLVDETINEHELSLAAGVSIAQKPLISVNLSVRNGAGALKLNG